MSTNKLKVVVLTGAGISAESGLQTFRDSDGLWNGHNVEDVATIDGWRKNPALVLAFYNARRESALNAQPNHAHRILAELEADFDVHIITQNIDNLHEKAGSTQIYHLHGEISKCRSEKNINLKYDYDKPIELGDTGNDGAQLRPDIVWFGEAVPMMYEVTHLCEKADVFVVIGTSLQVYPAASLIHYAPPFCHKFVIDKAIPSNLGIGKIVRIEHSATVGIDVFKTELYRIKDGHVK